MEVSAVPFGRWAWREDRHRRVGFSRPRRRAATPPNNAMQLTKLRAAPVLQAEVPPCAPAGETDGGTASQLIASVRPTEERGRPCEEV